MPKIFQRKQGGSWYVRLYANGKERWISLETTSKTEAERRARRQQYDNAPAERRELMRPPPVLFTDAWQWYLESPAGKAMKPNSLAHKALIFCKFTEWFKKKELTDVDKHAAGVFIIEVAKTRSPSTARRYLTNLRSVWKAIAYRIDNYANPWDSVPTIPSQSDKEARFRPFTDDELKRLRSYLAERGDDWAPMVEIALHTGLRLTDVVHLKEDNFRDGYISIIPAKMSRRAQKVLIPLHPAIQKLTEGKLGYLFPAQVERYDRNYTRLSQEFSKILRLLGIHAAPGEKVGFHSLRGTFITAMEEAGVRRSLVQAIVGHGSPVMTERYSRNRAGDGDISRLDFNSARKETGNLLHTSNRSNL